MKNPIRFFASTLAIGFFAVLPVLLFYLLLGQLIEMLRNLSTRLSGADDSSKFRPATVTTLPGVRGLCFIVEEYANGDFTVFVPFAPTPTLGSIYIVESDRVSFLVGNARQAVSCVASWGDGTVAMVGTPEQPGNG